MVIPKFRWWRCISCVPEARVFHGAYNKEAQKLDENADVPGLLLVGQSSKVNVPRVPNAEASTSIDSVENRNPPSNVNSDPKGKGKAHVDDEPAAPSAWRNGFLKDSSQMLLQTTGGIEVSVAADKEVIDLGLSCNGNGNTEALRKDNKVDGIEAGPAQENVTNSGEHANENCLGKPQASSEVRLADSAMNVVEAHIDGLVNTPSTDRRSRLINLPDLNECSGEPLYDDNNEAMITNTNNDVFYEYDDDYLGAERRKNPKVRLLSELLGIKETQISAKGKKKNPSLANSLDGSVKRRKLGSQEEVSKAIEIRVLDNGSKKITGTTGTSEYDSESATESDDVSTEIISKALAKSRCKSKIPFLEKRSKKSKNDHGGSSSMPRQKVLSKLAGHEKCKTSDSLPRKTDVADRLIGRSSVMTKKRGKLFQTGKEATYLVPCKSRMPKDFTAALNNENATNSPVQNILKASDNVLHFPRSFIIKRNCQAHVPEDGLCLPSSEADPLLVDGNSVRKRQENKNDVEDASVAVRTPAVDKSLTRNLVDGNVEKSICAKITPKEKTSGISEAEEGSPLAHDMRLQVSSSVPNKKEQRNEVRGRIHDIDINSIPTDDRVSDDIPMDIVELMAKNQYERHLGDPKEKLNNPAPSGIYEKYVTNNRINGSYGECWPRFGHSQFLSMQKPPSADPRNCMLNGNLSHFSDFNRNSLTVPSYHPRENPVSARILSPTQGQEHNLPYPPPCRLALNNWNGTFSMAAPQRYPPIFLQALESHKVRACAPRQNTAEVSHIWPSVVASRMPSGITNQQVISQSSNVLNKSKIGHHPTSGSILTFNAPRPTSLGKQQNLNFSNGYNVGAHSESSSDGYTNDAISAMHLLSLMQNAAKMQTAATLSVGLSKKGGRPTGSRQTFVENNGRRSSMQENALHPCYPTAIPAARPYISSFQSDGGDVGRNSSNTGFLGPIPLTLRGQRNMESSHFAHPSGEYQPQRRQMASSSQEKGKNISAISHLSYINPLHGVKDANIPSFLRKEGVIRHIERTILPTPEKMICTLNQNPSEFNDLKQMTRYMIGPDDLRPRNKAREKSFRPKGDSRRQGMKLNKQILLRKELEKQKNSKH